MPKSCWAKKPTKGKIVSCFLHQCKEHLMSFISTCSHQKNCNSILMISLVDLLGSIVNSKCPIYNLHHSFDLTNVQHLSKDGKSDGISRTLGSINFLSYYLAIINTLFWPYEWKDQTKVFKHRIQHKKNMLWVFFSIFL